MKKLLSALNMRVKITALVIGAVILTSLLFTASFYTSNKEMLENKFSLISQETLIQARNYIDNEFSHLVQLAHGGIIGYDIINVLTDYLSNLDDPVLISHVQNMLTQFVIQGKFLYSAHLIVGDSSISNLNSRTTYDYMSIAHNAVYTQSIYWHDEIVTNEHNGKPLIPCIFDLNGLTNSIFPKEIPLYLILDISYDELSATLSELESNVFGEVLLLNSQNIAFDASKLDADDYEYIQTEPLQINGWYIETYQKESVLFAEYYQTQAQAGVFLVLIAVVIIIFLQYVVRSMTQPLNEITVMAERMQHQDYSTKLTVYGKDEIAKLGKTFVQLQDELILYNKIVEADKIRIKQEEAEKRHIEMRLLQEQMNPHFLYNTLDSIYWYSLGGDSKNVCSAIVNLSQMLRISLSKGNEFISLEHEVQHLESYLTIQKQVFGDKFNYEINFDKALSSQKVIKIILQPLVENSILHGFEDTEQGGMIWVNIFFEGDTLVLQVLDNGVGFENTVNKTGKNYKGSGFALDTLKKRLKLHYHKNASAKHERTSEGLTLVEIRIKDRGAHV